MVHYNGDELPGLIAARQLILFSFTFYGLKAVVLCSGWLALP